MNSQFRDVLWNQLLKVYNKYTGNQPNITLQQLQSLLTEVLQEHMTSERDYVIRNMFRIDLDNNGTIDFAQFANFILKRHCGEISLQKMHANNQIQLSKERKINVTEFGQLINNAFKFLGVSVNQAEVNRMFNQTDNDQDGYITYVQYFDVIEKYVCKPTIKTTTYTYQKVSKVPTDIQIRQMQSRFRKFLWTELKIVYDYFDKDKSQTLDQKQMIWLTYQLLKTFNKAESDYIIANFLKINPTAHDHSIRFEEFAQFFIQETAQLGLSRFSQSSKTNRTIKKDEFLFLIKNSFSYIPISRVSDLLLVKIFEKLTKNQDYITFDAYIKWIKTFLCPLSYYGLEYYVEQDDQTILAGSKYITNANSLKPQEKAELTIGIQAEKILQMTGLTEQEKFYRVCCLMMEHMISLKYNTTTNKILDKNQVISLLKELRYDQDNIEKFIAQFKDHSKRFQINYQEFLRFLLSNYFKDCGLPDFIKMYRMKFKRLSEQILNQDEFNKLIEFSCHYFTAFKFNPQFLSVIFSKIAQQGWVDFKDYQQYMGRIFSRPGGGSEEAEDTLYYQIWYTFQNIFIMYDSSRSGTLNEKDLQKLLKEKFLISSAYQLKNMINLINKDKITRRVNFYELTPTLFVYMSEAVVKRFRLQVNSNKAKLNFQEFRMLTNVIFEQVHCLENYQKALIKIMNKLDADQDNLITFQEYLRWIANDIAKYPRV